MSRNSSGRNRLATGPSHSPTAGASAIASKAARRNRDDDRQYPQAFDLSVSAVGEIASGIS